MQVSTGICWMANLHIHFSLRVRGSALYRPRGTQGCVKIVPNLRVKMKNGISLYYYWPLLRVWGIWRPALWHQTIRRV